MPTAFLGVVVEFVVLRDLGEIAGRFGECVFGFESHFVGQSVEVEHAAGDEGIGFPDQHAAADTGAADEAIDTVCVEVFAPEGGFAHHEGNEVDRPDAEGHPQFVPAHENRAADIGEEATGAGDEAQGIEQVVGIGRRDGRF